MNIALVTATYPPYQGGTGRVCADQAQYLTERGHRVTVYCPAGCEPPARDVGAPRVVRLPALFRAGNAALVPGHLRIPRPDVLHLHYPYYGGGDLAWADATCRRIPYVVTYHQDVDLPGARNYIVRLHHTVFGRRILAGAQRILATTLDYARHSRLRPFLLQPGKVEELPNGVDTQRFTPAPALRTLRAAYGIGAGERVVLFVGSLDRAHAFKGVATLLSGLTMLSDLPIRLLIIGRGDRREHYQAQAARLGLPKRVIFDDGVDDAGLPDRYRLADVFVLPSQGPGEAFGVVLLEAMASGVPVIASDLPGVRSVVRATGGGIVIPPGDAATLAATVRNLLQDEPRRHSLGDQGRRAVEAHYAWPKVIDRLERLYKEVGSTTGRSMAG